MIVSSSNKYIQEPGNKIVVNDLANVFTGAVSVYWHDPANWSLGRTPTTAHRVVIASNCNVQYTPTTLINIKRLTIEEGVTLKHTNVNNTISVDYFENHGTYDLTISLSILRIRGTNSTVFGNMLFGTNGSLEFTNTSGIASVPNLDYYNLTMTGSAGIKRAVGDITVRGSLVVNNAAAFDLDNHSLNVNITNLGGQLIKNSSIGTITSNGLWSFNNLNSKLTFGGDFDMRFRSNIAGYNNAQHVPIDFGNASVIFEGNNISITTGNSTPSHFIFRQPVTIDNIQLSLLSVSGSLTVYTYGIINGTTANSKLLLGTGSTHAIGTIDFPMSVGIYDYTTSTSNTVAFVYNGDMDIPNLPYNTLGYGGSGVKKISGDMIVNGLTTIPGTANTANTVLEIGEGVVDVGQVIGQDSHIRMSYGSGHLICRGLLNLYSTRFTVTGSVTPTIELKGGMNVYQQVVEFGYANIIFSEFSQTLYGSVAGADVNSRGSILIQGDISVHLSSLCRLHCYGSLNGSEDSSTLLMRANSTLFLYSNDHIMTTGAIDASTYVNSITYKAPSGIQNIQNDIAFWGLTLSGGAIKTLQDHLSVLSLFLEQGTFECGVYDLTVNGTMTQNSGTTFSKTGEGIMLFKGAATFNVNSTMTLAGNPTVEFWDLKRLNSITDSGTGDWRFAENNQTFSNFPNLNGSGSTNVIKGNITVVGNITVTQIAADTQKRPIVIKGVLDGTTVNSKWDNRWYLSLDTSTKPMQTGQLVLDSAFNYIIYGGTMQDEAIFDLPYWGLSIAVNNVTKQLSSDLVVKNLEVVNASCKLECGDYNLTIENNCSITGSGNGNTPSIASLLSKIGAGFILIKGTYSSGRGAGIYTSSNVLVEFRGNVGINGFGSNYNFNGATVLFSSNNNIIISQAENSVDWRTGSLRIADNTTVTLNPANESHYYMMLSSLDGLGSNAKFISKHNKLSWTQTFAPMSTGILDLSSFSNVFEYTNNSSFTIPDVPYWTLSLVNDGLLGADLILKGMLTGTKGTILDCGAFNFEALSTATLNMDAIKIKKNEPGTLIFHGKTEWSSNPPDVTGATSIEFKRGFTSNHSTQLNFASLLTILSDNNQTIGTAYGSNSKVFLGTVQIAENVEVSISVVSALDSVSVANSIEGSGGSSKLTNKGRLYYQGNSVPMAVGALDCSNFENIFSYNRDGDQDVKGALYSSLDLGGTGIKTLQGDITVNETYTLSGTAIKNDNGYSFITT